MDEKNISEEISYNKNSSEVIDHTCDQNGNNLFNTEGVVYFSSIHSINATNYISMNDDEKFIYKYFAPFLSSNNREDLSSGSEYD